MLVVAAVEVRGCVEPPLCVDLDGTLVRSDTLLEATSLFLRAHPARAILLPLWLLRGIAYFKRKLASQAGIDPATLPYNQELLSLLRREHARGRKLVLVTAADSRIAERIASHIGIFSAVIASDGKNNLKGRRKCNALVAAYGAGNFDYAGDARSDLPVWRAARTAILVRTGSSVAGAAPPDADRSLAAKPPVWPALVRAMRPHQWLKNLLIFVPLMLSHRISDGAAIAHDAIAFAAFSLCASGIYLFNDFLDLDSDRAHRSKCRRPLASGALPLGTALAVAFALVVLSLSVAIALSPPFMFTIGGYLLLSFAYSLSLKRVALLDVVVLATLYATRLIAGALAANVILSFWLLAFALFMFASLALLKRYSELVALRDEWAGSVSGRDYAANDAETIAMFGICSGYVAVLVVALYIHGDLASSLYAHVYLLWAITPLLLYWISRAWLIARRGGMNEDPLIFAFKDWTSLVVAALCLAVGFLASLKIALPF